MAPGNVIYLYIHYHYHFRCSYYFHFFYFLSVGGKQGGSTNRVSSSCSGLAYNCYYSWINLCQILCSSWSFWIAVWVWHCCVCMKIQIRWAEDQTSGRVGALCVSSKLTGRLLAAVSHTWEAFAQNEASPTDDGESVPVGASGSQHGPGVREEQREAARLAAAERQHGLVGYPTDLQQRDDSGASYSPRKRLFSGSNGDFTLDLAESIFFLLIFPNIPPDSHLAGQPAPCQHRSLAVHDLTQVFFSGLLLQFTVGGAASLLLQRHHGADTRVHLPEQLGNIWNYPFIRYYSRLIPFIISFFSEDLE